MVEVASTIAVLAIDTKCFTSGRGRNIFLNIPLYRSGVNARNYSVTSLMAMLRQLSCESADNTRRTSASLNVFPQLSVFDLSGNRAHEKY